MSTPTNLRNGDVKIAIDTGTTRRVAIECVTDNFEAIDDLANALPYLRAFLRSAEPPETHKEAGWLFAGLKP